MSEEINATAVELTADQLADKKIIRELMLCIGAMMGIAVVILTTANSIA